jgi:2''-5'' RNA ligase
MNPAGNAMFRLFIALEIPQELRKALIRYERELPFWRWCKEDQLHLTMRFIGDTPRGALDRVTDSFLAGFEDVRKVRFTYVGYGFTPSEKKASTFYVRMQCSHAFDELKSRVDDIVLSTLNLPKENREFMPHITTMRMKKPPVAFDMMRIKKWADNMPKLPEPFAQKIILYRSELKDTGAVYTPLAEKELYF